MYEEVIQKIKDLGLDNEKADELFNLLSGEIIDHLFAELANISEEEEMQVYEERIKNAKSPEHFQTILNEIALKVYGDNYAQEITNNFDLLINEIKENIKQARELIQNQEDATNKSLIDKAQQISTDDSTQI